MYAGFPGLSAKLRNNNSDVLCIIREKLEPVNTFIKDFLYNIMNVYKIDMLH